MHGDGSGGGSNVLAQFIFQILMSAVAGFALGKLLPFFLWCKHTSGATPMVSGGVGAVVGAALVAIFRFGVMLAQVMTSPHWLMT